MRVGAYAEMRRRSGVGIPDLHLAARCGLQDSFFEEIGALPAGVRLEYISISIRVYIYIYIYMVMCIYIYIERER